MDARNAPAVQALRNIGTWETKQNAAPNNNKQHGRMAVLFVVEYVSIM
jgi:hypothetical protein